METASEDTILETASEDTVDKTTANSSRLEPSSGAVLLLERAASDTVASDISNSTDRSYSTNESPRKLKRKPDETTAMLVETKRALKVQKQKGMRLRQKVDHLQTAIESLQESNIISANRAQVPRATFSGGPRALSPRKLKHKPDETTAMLVETKRALKVQKQKGMTPTKG